MITVEELIVQSLYYRLVVVNVKKTEDEPSSGGRVRLDSSSLGPDSPVGSPRDGVPAPASDLGPGLGGYSIFLSQTISYLFTLYNLSVWY